MTLTPPRRRCAVYTRKSSEEGLDQAFNSLDAQRDACEAYIRSQKAEGWTLAPGAFDDGGISGGTMERPGLRRLLDEISRGRIDVVVVYKVDRLTRSLADFAKMVEVFDAKGVSFVSVTQQFNTTSSMGRLTLNVLLSFAQFEREVTGERIRDKIAASKARGMWMGGRPPLGYDPSPDPQLRTLVINEAEAITVSSIFSRYLELGSVHALRVELDSRGIRSKGWRTKQGKILGDRPFSTGALFHLLKNRIYIGQIVHGEHPPSRAPRSVDRESSLRRGPISLGEPDHGERTTHPAHITRAAQGSHLRRVWNAYDADNGDGPKSHCAVSLLRLQLRVEGSQARRRIGSSPRCSARNLHPRTQP